MSETIINTIKRTTPLAPYVAKYTGGLKATGRDFFVGRCPFHKSKSPKKLKFWVSSKYNLCGCFVPSCKAYANQREDASTKPLDIINFYCLLHEVDTKTAIEQLRPKKG